MKKLIFSLVAALFSCLVQAEVILPKIFADHMVLQRDQDIPVWGWADPREKVEVIFKDKTYKIRADKTGKWEVKMDPSSAGGPYTLTVNGEKTLSIKDVLVGDVWLLGGQSNMEWPLNQTNGAEDSIKMADYPQIRLFEVGRNLSILPIKDVPEGSWNVCTPQSIADFSAIGYYFGKRIHLDLDVPIGLLDINWGGTVSEAWTSPEALLTHPDFKEKIVSYRAEGETTFTNSENKSPNSWPSSLYNGMLEPIIPFGIKGALWYQGESNAGRAYQYREIFPLMIQDWRKQWGQGDFPFLWVQLANFKTPVDEPGGSNWAELREAQSMALSLPSTGQAVIIDKGEAEDIHPRDKWTVGERLALSAKKVAYGQDLVHSGPTFHKMEVEGNQARIIFNHIGSGIKIKDKYGYVKGFSIAGEDQVFYWANAYQDGDDIVVFSDQVAHPKSVRYGWADNPEDVNVYNKEGLPASPFRTDNWDGITLGKN
jgi:sialate O-acetylesterase